MTLYNYEKEVNITDDYYPIHEHLCVEYNSCLYIVPFQNTLTIRKIDSSDGSSDLIVTEAGSITKFYLDRSGEKLYYYHNQSTFSYVDLTDDSITDLDDTLDAVEDLFIHDGDLFAVDTSNDDLTFYKYTPGSPGTWGAVGTIAEGATNFSDVGTLGGNDYPYGICSDGTYFYLTDVDGYVYKYNLALDTLVDSFDVGALGGNDAPYGICWDGTYFYIMDGDNYVYIYDDFSSLITSHDLSSFFENYPGDPAEKYPRGICWDGTYFYIQCAYKACKLTSDFSSKVATYSTSGLVYGTAFGIETDGTYFYITATAGHIYKTTSDFSILITDLNVGAISSNDNCFGLYWDGAWFYVADPEDAGVYQYSTDLKTEMGTILYTIMINDGVYVIYQYIGQSIKIYVKDLTDSSNPSLLETISSDYIIPYLESQRGVSVSNDNDILYFILKDKTDGLTYLCTYIISTDTFTVKGEYNVSLMLDRNTDTSNSLPFNLEKGFGLTVGTNVLSVYQIASSKGNLYKIADLTNVLSGSPLTAIDGTIVAITDTYLILKRDDDSTELWKFQDFSSHYVEAIIDHAERDYPTAELTYDSRYLGLEDGMFIQIIGNVRVNGSTSVGIRFEGYVIMPEDEDEETIYIKTVDLLNPIYFDLKKSYKGTLSAGSFDDWLDQVDDEFDYGTKGVYDSGSLSLPETTKNSDKENQQFFDQGAVGEGFTWRARPTGEIDWTVGNDDSGLDYDQSTPIYEVKVSKKKIRPNSINVAAAYVNSVQVESESDHGQDLSDQQEYGIIPVEVTIAWIITVALANSYADEILAVLNQEYIEVQFFVHDETNGFVPPAEEITLADSNKGITSAQFKINAIRFYDKTNITHYTVSSIVRWDEEDLKFGFAQELSDQISQVAGTVDEIYDEGITASGAWYLKTSGDTDDYLEYSTNGTIFSYKLIGDSRHRFESDDTDWVIVQLYDDDDHFTDIGFSKTDHYTRIRSKDEIIIMPNYDQDDYLIFQTVSNIPRIGAVGTNDIYFHDGSNWDTIHADAFTEHSYKLPVDESLPQILAIHNKEFEPDKLDYSTIPNDAYYEKEKDVDQGVKINVMMWYLIKAIQEIDERLKKLEEKK